MIRFWAIITISETGMVTATTAASMWLQNTWYWLYPRFTIASGAVKWLGPVMNMRANSSHSRPGWRLGSA